MRTTISPAQPLPTPGPLAPTGERLPRAAPPSREAAEPFRALEVGAAEAGRLLAAGLARTVLADVLVALDAPDSRDLRAAAAALLIPPAGRVRPGDWVVGFSSAAWLHTGSAGAGDRTAPVELQVVIPAGRRRPALPGLRARQVLLPAEHLVRIGPVIVTDPVRTAADVARDLPEAEALGALGRLGELCGVRPDRVLTVLAGMRYARGAATARRVVTRWAKE